MKGIIDDVGSSVVAFLDNRTGITDVHFEQRAGVSPRRFDVWESKNVPLVLPDDYKALMLISDGFQLTWSVQIQGEKLPLGCMNLNSLNDLTTVRASGTPEESDSRSGAGAVRRKAFDIDNSSAGGTVALCFMNGARTKPQVWFRDNAAQWHFIANSFTDYCRLMIMHLGLPSWHYAFTNVGLDPISKQWFRFLSPERLAIDIENFKMRELSMLRREPTSSAMAMSGPDGSSDSDPAGGRKHKSQLNLAAVEANSKSAKGVKAKAKRPNTAAGHQKPPRSGDPASGGSAVRSSSRGVAAGSRTASPSPSDSRSSTSTTSGSRHRSVAR